MLRESPHRTEWNARIKQLAFAVKETIEKSSSLSELENQVHQAHDLIQRGVITSLGMITPYGMALYYGDDKEKEQKKWMAILKTGELIHQAKLDIAQEYSEA